MSDDKIVQLPVPGPGGTPIYVNEQSTLRDQFAMAVLAGFMARPHSLTPTEMARVAYQNADAMMEARREDRKSSTQIRV